MKNNNKRKRSEIVISSSSDQTTTTTTTPPKRQKTSSLPSQQFPYGNYNDYYRIRLLSSHASSSSTTTTTTITTKPSFLDPRVPIIHDQLHLHFNDQSKNDEINGLDIGCNTGLFTIQIMEQFNNNNNNNNNGMMKSTLNEENQETKNTSPISLSLKMNMIGVDIDPGLIRKAKKMWKQMKQEEINSKQWLEKYEMNHHDHHHRNNIQSSVEHKKKKKEEEERMKLIQQMNHNLTTAISTTKVNETICETICSSGSRNNGHENIMNTGDDKNSSDDKKNDNDENHRLVLASDGEGVEENEAAQDELTIEKHNDQSNHSDGTSTISNNDRNLMVENQVDDVDGGVVEKDDNNDNIRFMKLNFVQEETVNESDAQKYHVIFCMSVSKWIHLNFGDQGVKILFQKVYDMLKPGGVFVFEPQLWKSYTKRNDLTKKTQRILKSIQFRPTQFNDYLLNEIGFARCVTRFVESRQPEPAQSECQSTDTKTPSKKKGFDHRPICFYYKK